MTKTKEKIANILRKSGLYPIAVWVNKKLARLMQLDFLQDLILLTKYTLNIEIKQAYPRNITDVRYWENNVSLMQSTYLNKTADQLAVQRGVYELFNSAINIVYKKINIARILEVGCGFGYTLRNISNMFPDVEFDGGDFSQSLVKEAQNYLLSSSNVNQLFCLDATSMDRQDIYDVIYTHGLLMCMDKEAILMALNNFARHSKFVILIEMDFSSMSFIESLRFKRDRGYIVTDFDELILRAPFKILTKYSLDPSVCRYSKVFLLESLASNLA